MTNDDVSAPVAAPRVLEGGQPGSDPVGPLVPARARDLLGFSVGRVLPSPGLRAVGPFVFLDRMGPTALPPGAGLDVPPHPHIGLATVTYLLEGEIVHRDSLGSEVEIRAGDVNWMFAGRGIVHSERSGAAARARGGSLHGVQCWVAVPTEQEDAPPRFEHHDRGALPERERDGVRVRVVAGHAWDLRAPVTVASPTLFVDLALQAGAAIALPTEHEQRAVFVLGGEVRCGAVDVAVDTLAVLQTGAALQLVARSPARVLLLGGAPLGPRAMWWNFVATDPARIEAAKRAWADDAMGHVPGESERVPLPAR